MLSTSRSTLTSYTSRIVVRGEHFFFAVNGYPYHLAGEHLLRTLDYAYTYTGSADATTALVALKDALQAGPVVAGMLDVGFLTYIPNHHQLQGSDHAVVVLACQPDAVIVHDPEGYAAVPLPLDDFLDAWQRDIYTGKPYGLWRIGTQGHPPHEETIWERTLTRARANFARTAQTTADGMTLVYGPDGMRALAADLRAMPQRELGGLPFFSWRVSGQRCLDSALFLRERLPHAAALRWEECQLYGMLQHASATQKRDALPDLLERLAEYEACFIAMLE